MINTSTHFLGNGEATSTSTNQVDNSGRSEMKVKAKTEVDRQNKTNKRDSSAIRQRSPVIEQLIDILPKFGRTTKQALERALENWEAEDLDLDEVIPRHHILPSWEDYVTPRHLLGDDSVDEWLPVSLSGVWSDPMMPVETWNESNDAQNPYQAARTVFDPLFLHLGLEVNCSELIINSGSCLLKIAKQEDQSVGTSSSGFSSGTSSSSQ